MKTLVLAIVLAALAGFVATPVRADQVVYQYAALRGDVSTCKWFDENLNDRSEGALVRQIDLIYNRLALPAGAPVTVGPTATTSTGTLLAQFDLNRTTLCAGMEAIRPLPVPSSVPALP